MGFNLEMGFKKCGQMGCHESTKHAVHTFLHFVVFSLEEKISGLSNPPASTPILCNNLSGILKYLTFFV